MTFVPITGKCPVCHNDSANSAFQAGAASRDAEIAELNEEVASLKKVIEHAEAQNLRDLELAGIERDQLREQVAMLRASVLKLMAPVNRWPDYIIEALDATEPK